MNSHFDPDDPRLTAYALGELPDPADRAHVEALLAASLEARAELADIRALTATLTAEYEQEHLAANEPTNVIRLPDQSRSWRRPLLAVAAVLIVGGILAGMMLPVFNSVQTKTSSADSKSVVHHVKMRAQGKDEKTSSPEEQARLFAQYNDVAPDHPLDKEKSLALEPSPPALALANATPAPVASLLADAKPAAAPPGSLAVQSPPVFVGQVGTSVGRDAFYGANAVGGALLAEASKKSSPPVTVEAGEMVISSSNISSGGEVVSAPARPMLSQSQELAPRQLRAAAMPLEATGKAANTKRAEASVAAKDKSEFAYKPSAAAPPEVFAGSVPLADVNVARARLVTSSSGSAAGTAEPEGFAAGGEYRHEPISTAAYDHVTETPFLTAKENPLSTFSVDVDTASYSIVRRFIEQGSLPPAGAVRIEEMLNYFPYDYAPPAPGDEHPFAVHLEGAACPWNPDHRLVRVALKGREIAQDKRPPSNLVFLLDVSGSMEPPERLPLIKESLRLLVEKLTDNDRVAIVVYAGNSGLVLPSTNGAHKDTILHALGHLEAGGSTNGASGIKLAYKVAQENFLKGGTNRVILATDGDFNVGTTSQGELVRLIEKEAKGGVFLSVLGVGTDNLKDSTMQKLADHGNGNYAYLDSLAEGKKVLVEQMSGTLVTIAKDVKIQVEFNPWAVDSYRLIGYEKRMLRKEDFNDDRVDAGEIGAGHSVTALYEVIPLGQHNAGAAPSTDALKYQPVPDNRPVRAVAAPSPVDTHELLTVKIRHKAPDSDTSERSYEVPFTDHGTTNDYANASPDFKFAAAVATFGMVLRNSPYKGNATLGAAIELAQDGKGADPSGYRAGFIELARRASKIR